MTVEDRVANFLIANQGHAYCHDCLAREVRINRYQARNATSGFGSSGKFRRALGTCSKPAHDRDKKVIVA